MHFRAPAKYYESIVIDTTPKKYKIYLFDFHIKCSENKYFLTFDSIFDIQFSKNNLLIRKIWHP